MLFVRFLNPLLMVILGLGAGAVLAGRRAEAWRFYFVGVVTFILSQVLHIPFNVWILNPWIGSFSSNGSTLLIVSVFLGLSAGVFEEIARYVAFRFVVREARDWHAGVMFGAGHGGVEAVLVGLFALYTVMQLTMLRGQDVGVLIGDAPLEQLERVQAQVAAFWALPWYAVLLGALERLFAILFHLSASLMVLQVFLRRNLAWLLAAILWHTALDAVAVYVSSVWGIYWAEAAVGLMALVSVGILWALRDRGREEPDVQPAEQELLNLERVDLTQDQIDSSRFS